MSDTVQLARWSTGSCALLLVAALAACTADDQGEDEAVAQTSASESVDGEDTPAAPTSDAGSGDVAAVCDAAVDLDALFAVDLFVADKVTPPEQRDAALQEWNAAVRQQTQAIEGIAPADISADVKTVGEFIDRFLTFGRLEDFENPEFARADDNLDENRLAQCGYPHVEATGVDLAYQGFPATLPAGVVAVTFNNAGDEQHEMVVARFNDDVTMPLGEVLALPEDQASSMMTPVGHVFPVMPGEAETAFIRMGAGRYGVSCHVLQGTTQETDGSGPPHHALGMVGEFTVQ